jgi:hypothetical protein
LNNVEIPQDEISDNFVQINDLESLLEPEDEDFYDLIKREPNKQFYFGMEFKKINNPEFNDPSLYPIKLIPFNEQYYTPQINEISFEMPEVPLLSQFNEILKV